jgi:hypothetical protein
VGGFGMKYEVNRPLVLVVWPIQEGTNFSYDVLTPRGILIKKSKKYMSKTYGAIYSLLGKNMS